MRQAWEPRPGDRLIRYPREEEIGPVKVSVGQRRGQSRAGTSPLIIIYIFAVLVAIGTGMLLLPFTHNGDGFTPLVVALFTATSAVTVTGLVVENTTSYWTQGGQIVLLGLMFVGGLGFMTLATFLIILVGQRVTLSQRLLVRESLGVNQLGGLVRMTVGIVVVSVGIQVIGFIVLAVRFSFIYTPGEAIWQAAFHSISSFNNAGFIALKERGGLAEFQSDWMITGVMAALIVLGSLSYVVIMEVVSRRKFALFALNTKLILLMTPLVLGFGMVVFLLFEYQNPGSIGPQSVGQKLVTSLFESISKTAGFTTVDYGATEQQTNFVFAGLMFIGGASASVAGGIKINTLGVVLVSMFSTIKGRSHASVFGREIPDEQVRRALLVGAISTAFVFSIIVLLTLSNSELDFLDLFFESVSAFGTVGWSTGITPQISSWGHLILVIAMFVGRIGPFTIGLALAPRAERDPYRFAQERVTIG
ncbi:Trk family potassium uptake protein [Dehalococcoidia bacterium]|nr:Trk family potassium uptake protein [Dehalococcoidia bacterium]